MHKMIDTAVASGWEGETEGRDKASQQLQAQKHVSRSVWGSLELGLDLTTLAHGKLHSLWRERIVNSITHAGFCCRLCVQSRQRST